MSRSIAKCSLLVCSAASLWPPAAPSVGNAISVDKYQDTAEAPPDDYIINIGDVLQIAVWEQPTLSGPQPVRPDGRISVQLINEIQAAGKTPVKLQADIEAALKSVVLNPRVNVGVTNPKLPVISVVGEVGKQGDVELKPGWVSHKRSPRPAVCPPSRTRIASSSSARRRRDRSRFSSTTTRYWKAPARRRSSS